VYVSTSRGNQRRGAGHDCEANPRRRIPGRKRLAQSRFAQASRVDPATAWGPRPQSGTERVCAGSHVHGVEGRGLGLLNGGLRKVDRVKRIGLGHIGIRRRLMGVEPFLVFLDVPPHFGDMGLPLVPDVLPLRLHLFAVTVGLVLEPIGCRGGLFSCGSGVGSELIVGFITGRSERVGRRFRSVGDLLELCAEIVVCHRALLHQLRWAYSQRGHFRQG